MQALDWAAATRELERLLSAHPFDERTKENAHALMRATAGALPLAIDKGYWDTICFLWNDVEVEIFDDHLEFYRFPGGKFDVHYFSIEPGEEIPAELIVQLASVA